MKSRTLKMLNLLRLLLIPLTGIYYIYVKLKNFLYDSGFIDSYRSKSSKVISIGNISTGGTGKTPLTEIIASYYVKKNIKTAVISRGYKRKSKNLVIVLNECKIIANVDESGDELFMLAQNLNKLNNKDLCIIADSDRIRAVKYLDKFIKPDIIILDDAFQHRKIYRDLDIVLIDSSKQPNIYDNILLPSGNLRENIISLNRASVIVLNKKFNPELIKLKNINYSAINSIESHYISSGLYDCRDKYSEKKFSGYICFAGIADPESFFDRVKESGLNITYSLIFGDHHNYSQKDIDKLIKLYNSGLAFLTTQKDIVKLLKFSHFLKNYNVFYLKIDMIIDPKFYKILD